jgi:hypothetical protein
MVTWIANWAHRRSKVGYPQTTATIALPHCSVVFRRRIYLCASGVLQMTVTPFAGTGRNLLKGVLFAPCAADHRPRSADYLVEAVVVDDSTNSPRLLRPAHIVQGCA